MVFSVFESNNNFGSLFFVVAGPRMTLAYSIIFVFFLLVGRLYGEQDDPLTIIECPFDVVEEGDRGKDFRFFFFFFFLIKIKKRTKARKKKKKKKKKLNNQTKPSPTNNIFFTNKQKLFQTRWKTN